jgi:hypothetical protein
MGIAQQGLGTTMPHEGLHADERIAHLQAPTGEGMDIAIPSPITQD